MYQAPYRAFTDEYRVHMDRRGGWPRDKHLSKWFKANCGYAGGTNTAMRRGDLVPDKYPEWYLRLLVQQAERVEVRQARLATLDFVARFGITELTREAIPAVLGHICTPPIDAPEAKDGMLDYLAHPVDILRLFQDALPFESHARACGPGDLPAAIDWMYTRVGQCTAPTGHSMPAAEAIAYARDHIGLAEDEYRARAAQWQAFNPWTVVRAWHKTRPVGMSIVLPVTEAFYTDVRNGLRPSYDCGIRDLSVPSVHLIIEAGAENPELLATANINPTRPLLVCLICQLAALSRPNRFNASQTLRVLTFSGTPKNRDRLMRAGFVPTSGPRMARTGLELLERTLTVGQLGRDILSAAVLHFVGHLCQSAPRTGDAD